MSPHRRTSTASSLPPSAGVSGQQILLTGQRFGQRVVMRAVNARMVETRCDCGVVAVVVLRDLRCGKGLACSRCARVRHGHAQRSNGQPSSREWNSWYGAKQRCFNARATHFAVYGGRGIAMCSRWRESFGAFLADMGPRPSGTSLDRIDTNGNYEPGNCRWSTHKEQHRNRRDTVMLTARGETAPVIVWADRLGIKVGTIHSRLRRGWSPEEALAPRSP